MKRLILAGLVWILMFTVFMLIIKAFPMNGVQDIGAFFTGWILSACTAIGAYAIALSFTEEDQ